jgi:hypothetical protein
MQELMLTHEVQGDVNHALKEAHVHIMCSVGGGSYRKAFIFLGENMHVLHSSVRYYGRIIVRVLKAQ